MRKLILAPMALACLIGSAVAQQAPTSTADQGKPGVAPWPVSWTGQSVLADLRVAGNPVAAGNPVPVSAAQGAAGAQEWITKDGADGPGTNPGAGARGWLSGIYGRLTSDPSTATKQDTGNTSLASIAATSNATSNATTSLASNTGAKTDAATASGADTSVIGALRAIRDRLLGTLNTTLSAGSAIVGKVGIDQTTPGTTNGVVVNNAALSSTIRLTGTNRSASVGTTAVTLMAANTGRQGWKIKNDSAGDLWINFDATATTAAGSGNIRIPSGAYLSSEPGFVETGAMSAIGSTASLAITAREY